HARQAHRALDVPRGRSPEAPADVRRLPRGRHDGKQGRDEHSGCEAMSETVSPLGFHPPEVPEEQARAGYYALLARLYYAGPDAGLLATIAGAEDISADAEQSELATAWNGLAAAAKAMDAEAARLEYEQLFVGTGKAEVTPYASYYLTETGREKILV